MFRILITWRRVIGGGQLSRRRPLAGDFDGWKSSWDRHKRRSAVTGYGTGHLLFVCCIHIQKTRVEGLGYRVLALSDVLKAMADIW